MRVAGFMSGSGTNIMKLIEHEKKIKANERHSPFEVVFLFSDRSDGKSAGEKIALENGIPYFSYDIRSFHRMRSYERNAGTAQGLAARKEYDRVAKILVQAFEVDIIALGGYMSYITLPNCVNVHPADLSVCNSDGSRKYIGDNAVHDAIVSGEKELRASTLWTDDGVDTGPLLMVSEPIRVELPVTLKELLKDKDRLKDQVDHHQNRLKEAGDWKIFPATIELIARGRLGFDEKKQVYVDGKAVPKGFR